MSGFCLRWDAATNIKFIKAYQQQVCLWDPRHPDYKNRELRNVSYCNILKAMNLDLNVKGIISKIRSLRNTYNSETLKIKKKLQYRSKIPWLHSLDFLKHIDTSTRSSIEHLDDDSYQQPPTKSTIPVKTPTVVESPEVKVKIAKTCLMKETAEARENLVTWQQHTGENNDEFYLFGNMVAKRLCSLPLEIALESEEMILAVLRKQRLKALNLNKTINDSLSVISSATNDVQYLEQSKQVDIQKESVQEVIERIEPERLQEHQVKDVIVHEVKIENIDED